MNDTIGVSAHPHECVVYLFKLEGKRGSRALIAEWGTYLLDLALLIR
jgi:hypothetical protein